MPYGTINADVIGTSVAGSNLGAGNSSLMKNRIQNGAMVIDQRNAGASVSNIVDSQYTLDRWSFQTNIGNKFSVQQNAGSVTPPAGFTNYLGITSTSAYSVAAGEYCTLIQRIEGFNTADLDFGKSTAKTITVSFWVRSSLTGTFGGTIGNNGQDRSYPFTYTISSANTWEPKTVTITGDTTGTWLTTNGIGLVLRFGLGVGSTYSGTAGSWAGAVLLSATGATSVVGTSGATFYITGVQLEVGSSATGFEYRQYGQELALCQRYYQLAKPPLAISAESTDAAILVGSVPFAVPMRASPTVSQTGVFTYEIPYGISRTQSSADTTLDASVSNSTGAMVVMGSFSSLTYARTYRQLSNTNMFRFSAEL